MDQATKKYSSGGFTLIELAIVLVIIGVLLGSIIGTVGARIDTTRRAESVEQLEEIRQAILGYAYSTVGTDPYLPCPDIDNNGDEDRDVVTGNCQSATGDLPWNTLGLGRVDVWNARLTYWVDTGFASSGAPFTLTSTANGVVKTRVPGGLGTVLIDIATNAAAVIFSHGKNGYGGVSADGIARTAIPVANVDEAENANADTTFISREPSGPGSTTEGGEFDDILIWLPEYELKAAMVNAQRLP